MNNFNRMSVIGGWVVFAIAFITYLLTLEPTVSLWDCGEFIATSYKLEVGHPPGTPLFFLINRLGAMFASEPSSVAVMINGLSALESALTIAFLFWSIAHLGRRLYGKQPSELSQDQTWAIISAATIGSLAYAFTDTFWFSAVEAEVYALSSLFTAVVFWAILKWENVADQSHGNRWLILIAYLMGLSIGAHILNLLAIPALVFIFYFKNFPGRPKIDLWKPTLASLVVLGGFYMMAPTVIAIGSFVDRIFVNTLSMPINSGLTFFVVLILAALAYGVWRTDRKGRATLNTIFLSAMMVVIGFSTYGIVLIRASVNPPMNSGNPSDPYTLKKFINREQYGSYPLIYGQSYSTPPVDNIFRESYLVTPEGKYKGYTEAYDTEYDPAAEMLLPRMFSSKESHVKEYKNWGQVKGRKVRTSSGEMITVPTFGENLRYFFSYQMNFMYWRYFLWNFVGRQNDIQSSGAITDGNWLSGIDFIDELYLGPQDNLPSEMAANRAHNTYYFLPFILGLAGLFFQLKRDGRNFTVVMFLFLLTGLAIIVYLNQTPLQPRERDYAYAGSFYAFAIWLGLGVLPLYEFLKRKILKPKMAACAAFVIAASVPAVLAVQNWDDHDRSDRYLARDMGYNYLNSTLPNSILVNHGDNDTFSVWYVQEVEGFRTDVRPMNSSYLGGNWYINQMRVRSNESAPVPMSMPAAKYASDAPMQFYVKEIPHPKGGVWTGKEVMEMVGSEDPVTKIYAQSGEGYDFIPSRRIALPVNKENVLKSGVVRPEDAYLIEDTIYINLKKDYLLAGEMAMLDMLITNDWERPIYTTSAGGWFDYGLVEYNDNEQWSYLQQDGSALRLVPIKSPVTRDFGVGRIDTELLYDNLMNKFNYGNIANPKVYVDAFVENNLGVNKYRESFARLATQLVELGDSVRAVQVLDRAMEVMPVAQLRYDGFIPQIVDAYWRAGAHDKGDALAKDMIRVMGEYIDYYDRFTGRKAEMVQNATLNKLQTLYPLYISARNNRKTEIVEQLDYYFK